MGRNGSYNQIHHERDTSFSSSSTTKTIATTTTFLPLLCRNSVKDTIQITQTPSCPNKNEPTSPKVSCMGQIKRHNTKKINPTTTTTGKIKYMQLKKIFSGRNLLITTTNTATYCRNNNNINKTDISSDNARRPKLQYNNHGRHDHCAAVVVPLNLAELDPPLPVVKPPCRRREEGDGGSLWKRRGGRAPLGGLQIQLPSNNNTCMLLPPPSLSL